MNKAILIGRVGKDPEIIHTDNANIAKFSLATSKRYKDREGNKQEKTEWHNVVSFGKLAEIIEKYVRKGDQVYIEGEITTRSWEDKEGNKRYTTEIIANGIELLGSKKESEPANEPADSPEGLRADEITDDLPF